MSTDNKWLKSTITGDTTSMNSKVAMTYTQVNDLHSWVLLNPFESILFGDYTKWCSSLMFYPFKINPETTNYKLRVNGIDSNDITCLGVINTNAYLGYTLGQIYYGRCDSFLDYEPYRKVQIWLPYYGFVDVKIADIQDRYVQFRLYVDYNSGSAQYVIGVNDSSVTSPLAPYVGGTDDTNTRIIGTYTFQLGYQIPITSTGWAEAIRNATLMAVKLGGSLAGSYASSAAGLNKSTSSSRKVYTTRSAKTGRQITAFAEKTTSERNTENYASAQRINTSLESVGEILGAFHSSPTMDKANNSIINSACANSIIVVSRRVTPAIDRRDSIYLHSIGAPSSKVGLVSEFDGYTEFSNIHLEGEGFGLATQSELAELEQIFSNGVLLRDRTTPVTTIEFTVYTDDEETVTLNADSGQSWESWVDSDYNTIGAYIVENSDYVYLPQVVSTSPPYITYNDSPVYKSDIIIDGANYNKGTTEVLTQEETE